MTGFKDSRGQGVEGKRKRQVSRGRGAKVSRVKEKDRFQGVEGKNGKI